MMGVYTYTLRSQTKVVAGRTIGRFAYAYKNSFWNESGVYRRRVALMHHHAENARLALPNVCYAIAGDFRDITEAAPSAVFEFGPNCDSYSDSRLPGKVVGYLSRRGRKLHFEPAPK
jgi:hypothetical protein